MREERLVIQNNIKDCESRGDWNAAVEPAFPYRKLDSQKLDLTHKKLFNKIKAWVAYSCGERFFKGFVKKKQIIFHPVEGLENLSNFQGGAIVTCNHIHPADSYGVLLGLMQHFKKGKGGGKRQLWKVVAESNYSYPGLIGFLMRNADTLPVAVDEQPNLKLTVKTFQAAQELLKQGKKILIYPEANLWLHYRKPRPPKKGAFIMAAKFNVPVIPFFYTLRDNEQLDADDFPVQEYTPHILPMIFPDPQLSVEENAERMAAENMRLWQECYKKHYDNP